MAVPFSNTKLRVPKGFQNVLEGLAREVLRAQPEDIYAFGAMYFENLLKIRDVYTEYAEQYNVLGDIYIETVVKVLCDTANKDAGQMEP